MTHSSANTVFGSSRPHSEAKPAVQVSNAEWSARNKVGLDWFSFFCANLQTGFGPFVSVYLTTAKWSQTDIGVVLMIGGFVGLVGQIPGGALVDRVRSKALIAGASVIAISISALLVASSSVFGLILLAWVLHAAASCFITPCISTISLALVGHAKIGERIGRNATFASVGSALAAGGMGAVGYYLSNQAVFFVTAALAVPALLALWQIRSPKQLAPVRVQSTADAKPEKTPPASSSLAADLKAFVFDRRMVVMAATITLYYLANAAMLPLIGSMLTLRSAHSPTIYIAGCIIVPQIMIALLSPIVGAKAQTWGRRPLLLLGLATVPVRGLLLGTLVEPSLLIVVQILDGMCSAVIGVLMPLVASDATRNNGRFALAQGIFGTAMGIGASFSATVAGVMTDHLGSSTAFYGLAAIAVVALLVPLLLMPETRDEPVSRGEEMPLRADVGQQAA